MLEIRDLSKVYPSPAGRAAAPVAALDGVSLALEPGEFVAVQGPSGSGKTSLLLAAGGLMAPSTGTIAFDGQDVYAMPPGARARWRARCIGFVFQQFHLIPYLSVIDNVLAPALAWPISNARGRAGELLEQFGLTARASHVPSQLSTGEQQRTALARALVHRPRILLCDEPTGNLDQQSGRTVSKCLVDFRGQGGAVLLVTHDAVVAATAQRTLTLQSGRLVLRPSPQADLSTN
ncbi:MAG: ABC transporter ATP-binding protein [Thermoguttaceae bacterium]